MKLLSLKNENIVFLLLFFGVGIAPLQLFIIKIGSTWLSLSFVASLFLLFFIKLNFMLLKKPIILSLLFVISIQTISLLWAIDIKFGIRTILYMVPFISIFISTYWLTQQKINLMHKIFLVTSVGVFVEAVLVIWFRMDVMAELSFLKSDIIKIFMQPNLAEGIFTNERNNVLVSSKSGAFFPNANVAGTYLALFAIFLMTLCIYIKKKIYLIVSVFIFLSSFFTGSKVVIIFGILLPIIFVITSSALKKNITLKKIIYGIIIAFILVLAILILSTVSRFDYWEKNINHKSFLKKIEYQIFVFNHLAKKTFKTRAYGMWFHAYDEFPTHILKGHGFGGWTLKSNWEDKEYYQKSKNIKQVSLMPPHNTLIYLWSQSGIFAVIFATFFILLVLLFGVKLIKYPNKDIEILGYGIFFSFLWLFMHGMGTNYGLVGERHIMPLMASFLGYAYARYDLIRIKMDTH